MAKAPSTFTLGKAQWIVIAIGAQSSFRRALAIFQADEIDNAYVRHFVRPGLERDFGFRTGRTEFQYEGRVYPVLTIASVEETGAFALAGVKAGDVPIRIFHMADAQFYRELVKERNAEVKINFIDAETYVPWMENDTFPQMIEHERACTISLGPK